MSVDAVTLEVVRNQLIGIAEEAGAALRRTAYSPNIKERVDCSTAVFDAQGRMVAQAEHIPVHLGSMPASVAAAIETFPALAPGDQVLVSDPYAGGTHLPDWTLVAPVHDDAGHLLGYAANRAHHSDVGGGAPGSMPAGATDVFQEGLRIPPVRLVRDGEEDRDLLALLLANTRTPQERVGDLRAQIGANRLTARRLGEVAEALSRDRLQEVAGATLDHAERLVRAALGGAPDGEATFTDVLDGDGVTDDAIAITATVRIVGDELHVDFTGTQAQVRGSVNAPLAVTMSACVYALRAIFAPHVPANDGTTRPLHVVAPTGTVVNPRPPASVAAGNVETSQRIVDVVFGALASLVPGVPAASQGTMNNVLIGGTDPRTDAGFSYYETLAGGQGALPDADGMSGVHTHMTNTKNTPIEAFELAYPLRVVEYRLRDGSGGAGRLRGGDGIRRVLEVLTDDATLSLLTERRTHAPWGLDGGGEGAAGRNALVRDGTEVELPAKTTLPVRRGDLIVVETPGGGAHGVSGPPPEPM